MANDEWKDDPKVLEWLSKVENILREDKAFQFHWKLVVAKLCYELALECDWIGFMNASMQYDVPGFHLYFKGKEND